MNYPLNPLMEAHPEWFSTEQKRLARPRTEAGPYGFRANACGRAQGLLRATKEEADDDLLHIMRALT